MTPGDTAVAVFEPVPVTVIVQATPAPAGTVNVALQLPAAAEKPATVDGPEQPPPHVALVRPEGAAMKYDPLPAMAAPPTVPPARVVKVSPGLGAIAWEGADMTLPTGPQPTPVLPYGLLHPPPPPIG